jgi:hypothetical protein
MSDAQNPGSTGDQVPPVPPIPPAPPVTPEPAAQPNPYAAQPNPYMQQSNPYATTPPAGYAPPAAGPSRLNVPGLVSLIAGSLGFLIGVTFGWIPFVGFFPIMLAVVGLVFGIVGFVVKNKGRGLAIAGTIVSAVALLVSTLITVVMFVAFSSIQSSFDDYDDFLPDEPSITDSEGAAGVDGLGSREQPAAVGDTVTFTDYADAEEWQVTVGEPMLDATADVMAADEFTLPPADGSRYVVIPLTYTYLGAETGYAYVGAMPAFLGSDEVLYPTTFASYPDSIFDVAELAQGEQLTANAIFEVPDAAVDGGVLELTSLYGISIYVALA